MLCHRIVNAGRVQLLAQRKLGEILSKTQKNKGGNPKLTGSRGEPVEAPETLESQGITKKTSSEAQKLAKISESRFLAALGDSSRNESPAAAVKDLIRERAKARQRHREASSEGGKAAGNGRPCKNRGAANLPHPYSKPKRLIGSESHALQTMRQSYFNAMRKVSAMGLLAARDENWRAFYLHRLPASTTANRCSPIG